MNKSTLSVVTVMEEIGVTIHNANVQLGTEAEMLSFTSFYGFKKVESHSMQVGEPFVYIHADGGQAVMATELWKDESEIPSGSQIVQLSEASTAWSYWQKLIINGNVGVIGDVVHGDKVHGDKIAGNVLILGNISNVEGLAIGNNATAIVNKTTSVSSKIYGNGWNR